MRYRFIRAEKAHYPVTVLCQVLQVARSGFYAWGQGVASGRWSTFGPAISSRKADMGVPAFIRPCGPKAWALAGIGWPA